MIQCLGVDTMFECLCNFQSFMYCLGVDARFGIFSNVRVRVVNRIKFHFPVSECYNKVDNRIGTIAKIIG